MNAGGHGRETADVLVEAEVADLAAGACHAPSDRCWRSAFGYRSSAIGPGEVVTGATFRVADGDAATAEAEVAEIVRWRREHQPGGANAGSVFANPAGDSAGRLIDSLGLKGLRVGGAVVSPKHANFFQAEGRCDRRRRPRASCSRCGDGCSTPPGSRWFPSSAWSASTTSRTTGPIRPTA